MDISIAVVVFLLTIFGSISLNGLLRNIAREKNWLIDIPNKSRKFHHRPTPLTGGIAIQFSMILGFLSLLFLADVKLEKEVFDLFSNNAETVDRTVYKKSLRLEESDQQTVFDLLVFENENDISSDYEVRLDGIDNQFRLKKLMRLHLGLQTETKCRIMLLEMVRSFFWMMRIILIIHLTVLYLIQVIHLK